MENGLIINAFNGDQYGDVANRPANEIILTAHNPHTGEKVNVDLASARLLAPPETSVHVQELIREEAGLFRLRLARFDDTPPVEPGVYLFFLDIHAGSMGGLALATARIDENLPVRPAFPLTANGGNT